MSTRLTFVRSGGLVAAPGLLVRADVTIDGSRGDVSTADGYHRSLEAAEAEELVAATNDVSARDVADLKDGLAADAFRYEFTITRGGRAVIVRGEGSTVDTAVARLVEWASAEADRIFQWRSAL
jgi:hypothetical protein